MTRHTQNKAGRGANSDVPSPPVAAVCGPKTHTRESELSQKLVGRRTYTHTHIERLTAMLAGRGKPLAGAHKHSTAYTVPYRRKNKSIDCLPFGPQHPFNLIMAAKTSHSSLSLLEFYLPWG